MCAFQEAGESSADWAKNLNREDFRLLCLDGTRKPALFGRNGKDCPDKFCLFKSETKNLLFNDNTECLAKLEGRPTYEKYLGTEYVTAIANLKKCSTSRKCIDNNFKMFRRHSGVL
ncbi:LTF [Cervus elaphus hippelaphus]|uniref:LTF n=1 Tax=Cervus elaphus hippelaphus TaxID=46360 RepID=A0A212C8Z7_CEREH|nr:LTF [Cervus elaphus hippelaphus]